MSVRIRYNKVNNEGLRVSTKSFVTRDNQSVWVVLNEADGLVFINAGNAETGKTLYSGEASNYASLLKTAKLALLALGVEIGSETRAERSVGVATDVVGSTVVTNSTTTVNA